jgi:hypothetical protein
VDVEEKKLLKDTSVLAFWGYLCLQRDGYKPPLPAFQIGKSLVGKFRRGKACRDVPNEAESNKSTKTIRSHGQYKIQS